MTTRANLIQIILHRAPRSHRSAGNGVLEKTMLLLLKRRGNQPIFTRLCKRLMEEGGKGQIDSGRNARPIRAMETKRNLLREDLIKGNRGTGDFCGYTNCPATYPEAHAHWKL